MEFAEILTLRSDSCKVQLRLLILLVFYVPSMYISAEASPIWSTNIDTCLLTLLGIFFGSVSRSIVWTANRNWPEIWHSGGQRVARCN